MMKNNPREHYIAGKKTSTDWRALRLRLVACDTQAWNEAFKDYFQTRLELRYLHPIKVLQQHGSFTGEGFSILAIQCSIVEFLESTAQGTNYHYLRRHDKLRPHEYASSKDVFVAFLRDRDPFSQAFDAHSAMDFYLSVRCALLHEASTKNGWRIRAVSQNGLVADVKSKIVFRDSFQRALLTYVRTYGKRLQNEPALQQVTCLPIFGPVDS